MTADESRIRPRRKRGERKDTFATKLTLLIIAGVFFLLPAVQLGVVIRDEIDGDVTYRPKKGRNKRALVRSSQAIEFRSPMAMCWLQAFGPALVGGIIVF